MSKYRVLYYPHFQPSPGWLLSILLLADQVDRIVPEDADPEDSDLIKELIQEIPGALVSYSPGAQHIDFGALEMARLQRAFQQIRKQSPESKNRQIQLSIEGGTIAIGGHVFLHHSKVSDRVRDLLIEEDLLLPPVSALMRDLGEENYYPVPEQASKLILSCIADRIARQEGLDTVTDEEFDFLTTSLNRHRVAIGRPQGSVEGALLRAVAKVVIPCHVEALGIQDYKELRESYTPLREAFKEYVRKLAFLDRLDRIEDPKVLAERISDASERIKDECDAYANSAYARRFKGWAPFSVSRLLAIGGTLVSSHQWAFALGAVAVEVLAKVYLKPSEGQQVPEAIRLLASLRRDVLQRGEIDALM